MSTDSERQHKQIITSVDSEKTNAICVRRSKWPGSVVIIGTAQLWVIENGVVVNGRY